MIKKIKTPDGYTVKCSECLFTKKVEEQETAEWLEHSHLRYHEREDDKNDDFMIKER